MLKKAENALNMERSDTHLNTETTKKEDLLTLSEFCAATGRSAWGILMDIKNGKIEKAILEGEDAETTMIPASELKKARARRSSRLSLPSTKTVRAENRAEESFETNFRESFDSTLLDSVEVPTSFEMYVPGEIRRSIDSMELERVTGLEQKIEALQNLVGRLELELEEQKTAVLSQTQTLDVTQGQLLIAEASAAQEREGREQAEASVTQEKEGRAKAESQAGQERDGRLSAEKRVQSLEVALEDAERRASAPWWKHLFGLTKPAKVPGETSRETVG